MAKPVRILASGLVSTLGNGIPASLEALSRSPVSPESWRLPGFREPIEVPYMAVPGAPAQAADRLAWLLDRAVEQVFAEHPLSRAARTRIPLYIGSSCYGIAMGEEEYQKQVAVGEPDPLPLPLDGFTQISRHLRQTHQLTGPDFAMNTACTATANALLSAAGAIASGETRYALVIGLEAYNATTLAGFHGMQLIAAAGMKPFDQRRDGLVLGEGCAALLLGSEAETSTGLSICGGASNCDTFSISASNPDGSTIADVMQGALDACGLKADQITAVKAHGTATPLNDVSEAAGMKRLFGGRMPPFFSLKAYLGHTLGSCGAMETALAGACLQQQWLPRSGGFDQPDPKLGITPLSSAMYAEDGYYLLNFFGFGGNNCSLILRSETA